MHNHIRSFLVSTRAGATAITAALLTIASMLGGALIIDHIWMVSHRDLLKSASDAAALAATLTLQKLPQTMSDADVESRLQVVAERYARFNVLGNLSDADVKAEDVDTKLTINRASGTVDALVTAPIDGTQFGALHGYLGVDQLQGRTGLRLRPPILV